MGEQYVVVNTSPTKTHQRSQKEIINNEHAKVSYKQRYNFVQIFDDNGKVKFSALKYSLNELFEQQPAFNEPLPLYNMMYDFLPQKIAIAGAKTKTADGGEGKPKVSKMEMARMNNLAMANICECKKDPSISPWMHYLKMVSNKNIVKELIQKVDKKFDHE